MGVYAVWVFTKLGQGGSWLLAWEVPDSEFIKEASILEQKAYRDTWGRGMESYLQWLYEAALLLRELLQDTGTGTLYVHLDSHVAHHAKAVLDEVFGGENFRNERDFQREAIETVILEKPARPRLVAGFEPIVQ